MKEFVFLLLTSLGALSVTAAEPETKQAEENRRPLTIVTLGDSITKGVRAGVTSQQTFASLLEKQLQTGGVPVRVIHVGIGG